MNWICNKVIYSLKQFVLEVHEMEQLFIKVNFIFTLLCQVIFFTMLDVVLVNRRYLNIGKYSVTGASTLLLYTIVAFLMAKIRDILDNHWASPHSTVSFLKIVLKCVWRILLEISRIISILLCLRDCKALCQFDLLYTVLSFTYYASTEKIFMDILISCANYFNYSRFDSMEHLYIPIVLKSYAVVTALIVSAILYFGKHTKFVLFASYFIIYLRLKDLYFNYIRTLIHEKKVYESFKGATSEELKEWNDVCAICLTEMETAKVTSCKHLFHPTCLRQCLKSSLQCPLCKQVFVY